MKHDWPFKSTILAATLTSAVPYITSFASITVALLLQPIVLWLSLMMATKRKQKESPRLSALFHLVCLIILILLIGILAFGLSGVLRIFSAQSCAELNGWCRFWFQSFYVLFFGLAICVAKLWLPVGVLNFRVKPTQNWIVGFVAAFFLFSLFVFSTFGVFGAQISLSDFLIISFVSHLLAQEVVGIWALLSRKTQDDSTART